MLRDLAHKPSRPGIEAGALKNSHSRVAIWLIFDSGFENPGYQEKFVPKRIGDD